MIVKSEIKKAIPPKPIQPEASPGQSAIYCVLLDSMSDRKTQYIAAGIASLPMCRCIRRFTKKKAASDTTGRKMFRNCRNPCPNSWLEMSMKKLVYLYLINYADEKPDLALLAVQSFIRVCERRMKMIE